MSIFVTSYCTNLLISPGAKIWDDNNELDKTCDVVALHETMYSQ